MWKLAQSVAKSGLKREIGFSIEGYIKKRNDIEKDVIEKVEVRNVAITKNPANPSATWETFVKSWSVGHEINPAKQQNSTALTKESLAQAVTTLAWANTLPKNEANKLWNETARYLDMSKKSNEENAVVLLQNMKGLSKSEAKSYLETRKG